MTPSNPPVHSSTRSYVPFYGHPPVCNVTDLIEHGDVVLRVIRERGEENEGLVKLYESGRAGQHIPQGSIKSFRQYADYMTLSAIPIWPITPIKVSFFLLFRLLMGDVTNGTPLRNAYLRSLARSLEHYREETARYFISTWPEAGSWIIRDGRGDPESRNDITHDILRICKQGQNRPIESLLHFRAVQLLVTADNPALTPDAWATRRRLSARWVRDRESANLPERQYAGGKFVGEPPKPPPLSARSTHWNRHLHDLRDGSEETSWIPNCSRALSESLSKASSPFPASDFDFRYHNEEEKPIFPECDVSETRRSGNRKFPGRQPHSLQLHISPPPPMSYTLSPDSYTSSARSFERENAKDSLFMTHPTAELPSMTPLSQTLHLSNDHPMPYFPGSCVLPSLAEAGLHPSNFPLPVSPGGVIQNRPEELPNSREYYSLGEKKRNFVMTPPSGMFTPSDHSCSFSSNKRSPSSIYHGPIYSKFEISPTS